jgi:hypothetical protein
MGSSKKTGVTENVYKGLDITVYRYHALGPIKLDLYIQTVIPIFIAINMDISVVGILVTGPGSDIAIKPI